MKHLLVVLALSVCTDARAHIVMSAKPMMANDLVLRYPRPMPAQYPFPRYHDEGAWRRGHPEIPPYAPYTPDYGWHRNEGKWQFQGIRNPYYREEYPRIDYYRAYRLCAEQPWKCGRRGR